MLYVAIKKTFSHFQLDVNFTIHKGVIGILGPSGCGKSLTLQSIAGLQRPDEGVIQLNNHLFFHSDNRIHVPTRHRNVGYMFQHYALFPHLTVYENIAFGLKKWPRKQVQHTVMNMIENVGLKGYENHYPHQLSGGQQQRVALARTLVTKPSILLLDEPFSALDHHTKQVMEQQFFSYLQQHFSGIVLFVTHHLEEAYRLCDELILYDRGRIIQQGKKERVFHEPENVQAAKIVGCKNIFPCTFVEKGDEVIGYVNGAQLIVPAHKKKSGATYVGIHSHHIRFVDEATCNAFSFRIIRTVPNVYTYDVTIQTDHFTLQASVSEEEWRHMHNKKVYLPPEHLFFLREGG
ncbi:sulfate/molybdate ABC transporter ATP-binding protein [Anoxybacillus flavithermus]|uniref:sulfate/molybdate ABC transporter ATP-binding protein n=1 Tax=Anoxybacillus flavithermus TaxID=33934 RepID=UPI001868D1E2|nr:ABC transporter ATP-binding protein [Anoxybacillus flavithermus]MBE2913639.1 ABC transporter ATP-binding protein [Anoxybacillus flavithermus]